MTAPNFSTLGDLELRVSSVEIASPALLSLGFDPRARWLGINLTRMLAAADASFGLSVLTDSTGDNQPGGGTSGDWPYEWLLLVGALYPAWTIKWYPWSDANQDYGVPVTVQTGSAGGERGISFTGTENVYALPTATIPAITSDLDVSVKLSLAAWSPAAACDPVAHWGASGQQSFLIRFNSGSKKPHLIFTTDGSTPIDKASTADVPFADGATGWVRAVLDVDNGASGYDVKFYTSTDGVAWSQLGSTVTTGTALTSIATSTFDWNIGGREGATNVINGKLYEVRIRQGIGSDIGGASGPIIGPTIPELWPRFNATLSPVPSGPPTLNFMCGAQSGKGIMGAAAYLNDSTRLKKMLPDYGLRAVFMSSSHNDGLFIGSDWTSAWTSWITAVKSQAYQAVPVMMTQNPENSPATSGGIASHSKRRNMLVALAGQLGVPSVDAYQAFLAANGTVVTNLIQADGIHPTLTTGVTARTGGQTWADYVRTAMFGS